ncbi:terminase TerL endonuclease subunit [Tomitella gaofuii]|uniref:terminase TerL endonuclease subunit n=1 Tax=Tomitella gaofuii TaxID=2760083 RepID=UPI0015FE7025|nr:terminase TerL endonuclease subunit [Tomitella gaofuii]
MLWLPAPDDATEVALGMDGSESDDWTAIKAETRGGLLFTPRYGPDARPTIWDPAEWGGKIPRGEVHAAVDELFQRYRVGRFYCDPFDWRSEIGDWSLQYGETRVSEWPTNRIDRMWKALRRFETDLTTGRITHDGCPITTVHMRNARKVAKPGQKYVIGKPEQHQKIDAVIASVMAHEAASDLHTEGWRATGAGVSTAMYGFS